MSTLRRYLAAFFLAMLAAPKLVFESGKWVLRSIFAPPVGAGGEVEDVMDAVRAAAAPTPSPTAPADTDRAEEELRVAAPFVTRTPTETEEALKAWGRVARAYAVSRLSAEPEPDMRILDESAETWLRGLTTPECQRLLDFGPRRVSDHMVGSHLISGLPPCLVRPAWMPPVHLADLPGDEPGYRVAA